MYNKLLAILTDIGPIIRSHARYIARVFLHIIKFNVQNYTCNTLELQ